MTGGGTTAGQAAYGVMWAVSGIDVRWEDLDADDQKLWDDIAQAGINVFEEGDHRQPLSVAVRALRAIAWGTTPEGKPIDPSVVADKALSEMRLADEEAAAEYTPAVTAAAAAQPARGGIVSAHFISAGAGAELQLVCAHEDASDVECDETIAVVEPGDTWDEMESLIRAHATERHPEAVGAAAAQGASGDELAMLRADIADYEALLAKWPKCPAGCNCRTGIDTDPDANECGCDGPCNGGEQPAPGVTAAQLASALNGFYGWFTVHRASLFTVDDITRAHGQLLGADVDDFARALHAHLESNRAHRQTAGIRQFEQTEEVPQFEQPAPAAAPEVAGLRELLDEIGVLAANAPEDDAFSVCEEITMRIAAHGIPMEGK